MQNDLTTGCTPKPSNLVSDRVEALLQHRSAELAGLAHKPDREFKLLEIWAVMAETGVTCREDYIKLRRYLSMRLRTVADRLRALKRLLCETCRLMPDASVLQIRAEIETAKATFNALIGLRRMSRTWSKAVRTGAIPVSAEAAPARAAAILDQLAAAVREERRLRAACRARWNSGRDDPQLERQHGDAHDRIDTLLKLADELKEI